MGLRPPVGLGIKCMRTSDTTCGQCPAASIALRISAMAWSKGSDSHCRISGGNRSTPILVLALKEPAARDTSSAVMGGISGAAAAWRHGADGLLPRRVQTARHCC